MCCAKPEGYVWALALLAGLTFGQPTPAYAELLNSSDSSESALSRIARTGKLVAGTRTDAAPFASQDAAGEWNGYSIDLLRRVRAALQLQLRRPVQLELVAADTGSLDLITEGQVDIVCGSTSYSQSRDLQADFSVGYFLTGTQLLINTEHSLGAEFIIGSIAGTTNQQLMRRLFPIAQFVTVDSRAMGLQALQNRRIDALASDGVLLEAMRLKLVAAEPAALGYAVVPDQRLDQEAYACLLPQGDLRFQQTVDRSLLNFMQGVLEQQPTDLALLEGWFGEAGAVPIGAAAWSELLAYFQQQLDRKAAFSPS